MRQGHMIGLVPVVVPDADLLRDSGARWLRVHVGFPFDSEARRADARGFLRCLDQNRRYADAGYGLLGATMTPGSSRYDPAIGATRWHNSLPDWAGSHEQDRYYDVVFDACRAMAAESAGLVHYWQIANEPDIDIFRGPLSDEQMTRFLLCSARGVKAGNPNARCGINLGELTPRGRALVEQTYAPADSPFDFIGLDGYFGSWQPGGPQNWTGVITDAARLARRPVFIHEWGYSSLQSGPITDDPQRAKPYNQGVCRAKAWNRVWRREHSPQEQADYVADCLAIFAEHPDCIGSLFFRWSDTATCWQCGQPLCPAECAWGMVDVDQRPKPAYAAFRDAVARLFR